MPKKRTRKAAAKDTQKLAELASGAEHPNGSGVDEADNNQTEQEEALPSGYDLSNGELLYNLKDSDPKVIFSKNIVVITTIPRSVPHGETQSAWIVNPSTKPKVLNASGYPARLPKPREDLYEIRSTPDMGKGVFAKRDINRGEIIIAERPLLVFPELRLSSQSFAPLDPLGAHKENLSRVESLLEATIAQLPPESQADFRALDSAYTRDQCGPLLGITRTNNFALRNLFDGSDMSENYKLVTKVASRINHSCVPNVKHYFKVNSFSIQFFALRDIKAGEQLFYPYCLTDRSLAQRRADFAPYGFSCKCPGCLNATPETDKLRTMFKHRIAFFKEALIERPILKFDGIMLEAALRFEKDVLKEGLDADDEYLVLLLAISAGYSKIGNMAESRKYRELMEKFQKLMLDEWKGIPIPGM